MRPYTYLLLSLTLLFFAGCGDEDPVTPHYNPAFLVKGILDAEGGELDGGDIVLTVPPGAFSQESEVRISDKVSTPRLDSDQPKYIITGLPSEFGVPLTLRFRFEVPEDGSGYSAYIRETRESHEGGRHDTWFETAARDSAGWIIFDLTRGGLDLGNEHPQPLTVTVFTGITSLLKPEGHFRIFFNETVVSADRASEILDIFESNRQRLYDIGFRFGDLDALWPMHIYLRNSYEDIPAEYMIAPPGEGHFNFDPATLADGFPLPHVAMHQLFHYAQEFYDTRSASDWTTVNPARHWLDEATACVMESRMDEFPLSYTPVSATPQNYLAPLTGIGENVSLSRADHGYGMYYFMSRLASLQGLDRIHDIYVSFTEYGTIYDAIMEAVDPPLDEWCAQFQRNMVTGMPTRINLEGVWRDYPSSWDWDWDDGFIRKNLSVSDYGSAVWKVGIRPYSGAPPEDYILSLYLDEEDILSEPYEIAIYGQNDHDLPVLLGTGENGASVPDCQSAFLNYENLLIQLIKPWSAASGVNETSEARVSLYVRPSIIRHEYAKVDLRYHAIWNTGVRPWQSLVITADAGIWQDNTYTAFWDHTVDGIRMHGRITATADPHHLTLMSWDAESTWEFDEDTRYYSYTEGNMPVPVSLWEPRALHYRIDGAEACQVTTTIIQYSVSDGIMNEVMENWTCNDDSYFEFTFRNLR